MLVTLVLSIGLLQIRKSQGIDEAQGNGPYKRPLEPADLRFSGFNDDNAFQGYSVIQVTPRTRPQLQKMLRLKTSRDVKVDFWQEPSRIGNPVDIMVSPSELLKLLEKLKEANLTQLVQMADVDKSIKNQNLWHSDTLFSTFTGYDYGRYHGLQEINDELHRLAAQYSSLATIFQVGTSHEGRPMYAIKISSSTGNRNKKIFFFNCAIHAREWVTPATCMYMINQMLTKYGRDNVVTAMVNKMDWIVLPVFNVDGYAHTWTGSQARFWRKTRKPNAGGCVGTDPNRNWNINWGGVGTSGNPCSDTYHGPRAFSEVEVLQVARYLYSIRRRLVGYTDIHAYSQLWMYPWGHTTQKPRDVAEMSRVSVAAVRALQRPYGTVFKQGPSSVVIYRTSGGSSDWVYGRLGVVYSFAIELRDRGRYGFLLPSKFIIPTAYETFQAFAAMAQSMRV